MRTTLFKAALTVGLFGVVQAAEAQQTQNQRGGLRTSGALSQTFEFRDSSGLGSGGNKFRSLTGVDFSLSSQTPTSTLSASSGVSLRLDKDGVSVARPKFRLGFGTRTKRVNYNANFSFQRSPASVNEELPDLTIARVNADRTLISGRFSASTALDPTTNLSFGVSATRVDFDPTSASLVPTTDYGIDGKLTYRLNRRTAFGLQGDLGYFEADNGNATESVSASLSGTLNHELDSRRTFDANLGFAFIDTTDTIGTATTSAFSVSLLYGAGLTQALPDGSIGISLNQSVNPSATGSLALNTQLNGALTKNVNPNESYTVNASLGRQEDVGGGSVTTFLNVAPSYSRQLTRDVSATASYFIQRDDSGSTAQGLTLSFSRPFDAPLR